MQLSGQKTTPLLAMLLAGMVGYIAYTGAVIEAVGIKGLSGARQHIVAMRDSITRFEAATDSAACSNSEKVNSVPSSKMTAFRPA